MYGEEMRYAQHFQSHVFSMIDGPIPGVLDSVKHCTQWRVAVARTFGTLQGDATWTAQSRLLTAFGNQFVIQNSNSIRQSILETNSTTVVVPKQFIEDDSLVRYSSLSTGAYVDDLGKLM